jgi:hypothetical protein
MTTTGAADVPYIALPVSAAYPALTDIYMTCRNRNGVDAQVNGFFDIALVAA